MIRSIDEFSELLTSYKQEDIDLILQAAGKSQQLHEGQFRASGDPYFTHPLQVGEILVRMRMDPTTIIAGLLHDSIEDTSYNRDNLAREFGDKVSSLVEGVTKIDIVRSKSRGTIQADTIRKMLFAMVRDIRVILIKLADKLHNMRTLEFKNPERIRAIAQECLDIYAPLASRLGINWMKDELEDLSLKHLHPEVYLQLKDYVSEKKSDRKDYLAKVTAKIQRIAAKEGIAVKTTTRAKHFYSIYSKMRQRGKSLDEIYDLYGVRIICRNIADCYVMLGLVHRLWMPIDGRFKDYIAMPKSNRYRSLHTTLMGYDGQLLEVQIRTETMEQTAQHGIAAHWRYKNNRRGNNTRHEDLSIINNLKNLDSIEGQDFLEEMKREVLKDSIYVFTPKGDVIQLPHEATAIDFAYHIHTEIGNHISGAKANGSIIPLKQPLKNTQVVEIITHPHAHPRLDWLRFAKTRGARSKIRAWLNKHDEGLFVDRNIVARQMDPHPRQQKRANIHLLKTDRTGVRVGQDRNLLVHFANCCKPKTGDDIVGYVSRGRGIIIHQKHCKNYLNIQDVEERSLEVEWETVSPKTTHTFLVTAHHTGDLFSEIECAIRKNQGHLIEGRIEHSETSTSKTLEGHFTMELDTGTDIRAIMKNIRAIPNVLSISRVDQGD